jgi:peroxiredoxin
VEFDCIGSIARTMAVALALAWAPARAIEVGSVAPDVSAPGIGRDSPGIKLANLRGRVVYVDFWASWCAPCRQSMPALDGYFRRFSSRGFTVLGVNKDMAASDAARFLQRFPVTFPVLADPDDGLARAFDVKAMPSGYLIDRAGRVRYVHRGFTSETAAALESQIEFLVGEAK